MQLNIKAARKHFEALEKSVENEGSNVSAVSGKQRWNCQNFFYHNSKVLLSCKPEAEAGLVIFMEFLVFFSYNLFIFSVALSAAIWSK